MEAKKFIRMKCPQCRARIFVDRGMKHWYCGHCGFQIEIREKPAVQAKAKPENEESSITGKPVEATAPEITATAVGEPITEAPVAAEETAAEEITPVLSAEPDEAAPAEEITEESSSSEAPAESDTSSEENDTEPKPSVNDIHVSEISRPQDIPVPVMTDEDRARMFASPSEYESDEDTDEYEEDIPDKPVEEFQNENGVLIRYNGTAVNVTIPDYIESIGSGAFKDNKTIRNVVIPDTVNDIADAAFDGCTELMSVTLPAGLKKIRYKTFNECDNLTSITIPASVSSIMSNAMCCGLKEIVFMSNITTWEVENEFANGSFEVDRKGNGQGVSTIVFNDVRYNAAELYKFRNIANYLIDSDRCQHCGGKFGLFNKCKNCGKKKDY